MNVTHPLGPIVTDVSHAEGELLHLWQSVGHELRPVTANLLVVTDARHLTQVRAILNEIGGALTGRQVVLVLHDPELPMQVSLLSVRRGFFVERIEAAARLEGLPSLAARLAHPATLHQIWWDCDEAPPPAVLRTLARSTDQLIIDFGLLPEGVAAPCLLSDLAWARTARWRELTAQFFGDPLAARRLRELEHVTIEYGGADACPAAYFGAWLADTLSWPDLSRVTQVRADQARGRGDLTTAELNTVELGSPSARFQLHACGPLLRGDLHEGGHDRIFEVRLPPLSRAEGLSALLRSPVRDEAFVRASALLRQARAGSVPVRSMPMHSVPLRPGGSTRPAPAPPLQTG